MGSFICDSCGREVNIYEGILSWRREGRELSNFAITHHSGADCPGQPSNNTCRDLFRVASVKGYLAFVQYLITRWGEGCTITDFDSLKRVLAQINAHIHEGMVNLLGE
ncbi:MAG: hypothetical protein IMW93_00990 [Thermoanaerobacteraceae bacterium]|uniref:Uncharacterized protein n=1 Tax=Desulfofundulus thermobenzoicus TaxID=29376 RepID=A0A6N7IS27_9FIRM|nr:hypothetical protein [Desulfofundulus thermobenzoicus]MBE3587132.1 hypothetical protein [Thermoanaerobacteraceae bacterium]MQL52874.1 hypothetical protein [Desulfofundulus thermobenzoicus]HHW44569.1 hypothetical protein [Desulfotomaculum sp.]